MKASSKDVATSIIDLIKDEDMNEQLNNTAIEKDENDKVLIFNSSCSLI